MLLRFSCLVVLGVLAAGPASAGEGVVEINQTCVNTGCFPGDTPGFPITIPTSGSYRLTSNLRAVSELGVGQDFPIILINSSNVVLDLGGFSLSCRNPTLPSSPCSSSPTSAGFGIRSTLDGNSVRNGTIRDMASHGISISADSTVESVRALNNAGIGIRFVGGVVRGCVTNDNGGAGLSTGSGSVVVENVSRDNGDDGIRASFGSVVARNAASGNAGDGFDLGGGSGQQGGQVSDNTATNNDGFGLRLENVWGYTGNNLTFNNNGNGNPQVSGGINLGQNVCGTNTSCP